MNTSSSNGSSSIGRAAGSRAGRARQQQQPLDDRVHPVELVERDVELGRVAVLAEQLEVAASDRDRRAQLVRGVLDEALLALDQRAVLLGPALHDPKRLDAAARVPHHRQEHRRHQRHLEQLAPELDTAERIEPDREPRQPPPPPPVRATSARSGQTRNPYTSVRLIQTKWNGIVSQPGHAIIAA